MTKLTSLTIRPLEAEDWPTYRELRLRSLADSADAFGSTLAEEQQRIPEQWAGRLSAATQSGIDYPLLAQADGVAAGLVWAKADAADKTIVNVFQMWVAPEHRGRGIAAALLREAVRWARSRDARVVQLGVTCGDTPAVRLYTREGFAAYGAPEPLRPGSPLLSQTMRLALA